ncbi:MAG: Gfo/Idh/MocA family oxidoreductase [Edaphobacter sp.]|uniref:Gfo/Idh/MocA family protein n=1 Tax=Edaphobacter sp. TaxID=1934404 RepID=UPI002387B89A|nr:Gfo/Idh/MocA family oxidoreductase [Edaphobacter sp.]MDE1177039.1 Gfo/Idh/MocA family oxidoreductase [Edaphobacter sp.]
MTAPVRFAILGFGNHAVRRLLPAFSRSEKVALTGMWRRDQEAAKKNCAEHGIAHCFATPEELVNSPEVDVVFITSPDAMHRDDTLMAINAGKAVLCEKPVSMNAAEASEMAAAAKAKGVLYGVAQNFRYNRSIDWMREQIAAGRIGTPQLAQAEYAYPADRAPRKWIMDPTLAAGGPIADVGVHCIDALRYILGEEVASVSTVAIKTKPEDRVEAIASLQMEMSGGVLANVNCNARAPYRTLLSFTGSDGVLVAESGFSVDRPVEVAVRKAGETLETVTIDNSDGYVRMLDAFARAFTGGESFAATGDDAVHNMAALDAAFRSWKTGAREKTV